MYYYGIPLVYGNLENYNDYFISIFLLLIISFFVLISYFYDGLEYKNIITQQLKEIEYISNYFIKYLIDNEFKYNIEKLMSCKREIDVLKCYSNDPKRFLEDLADCIKYNVYSELRLVSIAKKSKLKNQISIDNYNYFTNHFEEEKYDDFKTTMLLIKNVYINDILHLTYYENDVLIDYTYLKKMLSQIEIIFKEIKKDNLKYQGNENLRDFKDIICYSELQQDNNSKKFNYYYQATSLYEISIKLKEENAYDKNSDYVIRKYYYESHNFELQTTQLIHSIIDSLDEKIHNIDRDFNKNIKIKGKIIPIKIRYAADKKISTIGNKISRKDDLLSDANIPWSISLIKDFKRMSITFTNEKDIYLYIMKQKIKFGQDFTKEFISEEHNIRIRIVEIKNGFFGLNTFSETGNYRDVKIIYEFFIPDYDISYMMECQLNLNELIEYKKAEHIIYDYLRCEKDMLSVKKLKKTYAWYESSARIFLYNFRLVFVILAIATIAISTGIIVNYLNLDYNLILHSNYKNNFQFIQGLYPNNICYSIDKKLYSCVGNENLEKILNKITDNYYKKLVLSEEYFIGIDNSSNLFEYNLIDYSNLESSNTISDIQKNNNIICKLLSNYNEIECIHTHVYPKIIVAKSSQTCISANNDLECFGDWFNEFNYQIPIKVQTGVDQLSLGGYVHCAIKYTQLYCWGNNQYGMLDIPEILLQHQVTIISSGISNICAGNKDIIVCWGNEGYYDDQDYALNYPPEEVSKGAEILSAYEYDTFCAVASGVLYCWGRNDNGFDDIPIEKRQGISMMTTGGNNICIYIDSLTCYGYYSMNNPPHEIVLNTLLIQISYTIGCASTIEKFLCWGPDGSDLDIPDYYQTGVDQIALGTHLCFSYLNNYECLNYSQKSSFPIVNDTATNNYNLPKLSDNLIEFKIGRMFCLSKSILYCKFDAYDQEYLRVPKEIIYSSSFSIGDFNVCALSPTDSLICIGDNFYGQNDVPPAFLSNTTLYTIGQDHSCASTPEVFLCWGSNQFGQLDIPTPMEQGVQVMATLYGCTCAGIQDQFSCWGYLDGVGQIPDPVVSGVDSVGSGVRLVCAAKDSGFYCFGTIDSYFDFGQLDVPAYFRENGVDSFGVGDLHVCAQKDTIFLCWGSNIDNESQIPTHLQGGVDYFRTNFSTNCASKQGNWTCFGLNYIDYKFLISEIHTEKLVLSFAISGDYNLCIKYSNDTVYCKSHNQMSGELNFKVKEDLMCMYNRNNYPFLCYTDRVNSNQFICNSINKNSEDQIKYSYIGDSEVVKISCGLNHGCAMFESGEAICFGGSAEYNEAELPKSMSTGVYDIRAGYNITCVVNTTQILCTGKSIVEEIYIYDLVGLKGFESLSSQYFEK